MRAKTKQVYEALYRLHKERGRRPPTIRAIAEALGLGDGTSTVFYSLQELVRLGLAEKRKPTNEGLYVPVYHPSTVNWESLEKGDGDGRATVETARA